MGFFELLGLIVFLYFIVNIFLWIYLDTDIELFIAEKIGKPISSLQGKVVWITGASSGIGKHLSIVLAQHGVKLCLSARRDEELEKVKLECLAGSPLKAEDVYVLKMDMLETDKHQEYFEKVIKYFGKVDILVQNAGHIAVTSSTAGLLGIPNSCSYVGAKHALHGYFDSLKVEMPDFNVTIFCPGPTTTDFLRTSFTDKTGEIHGGATQASSKRMTAERCAFLMATSIANKLHMNFVGPFPVPFLAYVSLYCPNLRIMILKLIGKGGLSKIRDPEKKSE